MRLFLWTQVAAVAFLVSACPGTPATVPGGGNCAPGQDCSGTGGEAGSTNSGGTGGEGTSSNGAGGSGNGGVGGAGNGGAGNGGNGQGGNGQGGSGGPDPVYCEKLANDITVSQEASQTCNPEIPKGQSCKDIIEGLCCPIAVNDLNTPEVQAYLAALKEYQQAGCVADCPPDPCPSMPGVTCMSLGALGTCVLIP